MGLRHLPRRELLALIFPAVLLATHGCAPEVLIPVDDQTFERAQRRLRRTSERLDQDAASPEERVLFMQAEALFEYRYAVPPRSPIASIGVVLASLIDLPVVQSVSGSLDLLDVRLRSTNSAIQLWETLLARRPATPLRSLTLYRLGWAYPSSDVLGLPRSTGTDAFSALIQENTDPSLATLARSAKEVPMKQKRKAAAWSAFPGLGQFYVGRPLSGTLRLTTALAALAAVVVPALVAYDRGSDLSWRRDWPLLASSVGGLFVLSLDYASSYEDALRRAVEWNERAQATFEDAHPQSP